MSVTDIVSSCLKAIKVLIELWLFVRACLYMVVLKGHQPTFRMDQKQQHAAYGEY